MLLCPVPWRHSIYHVYRMLLDFLRVFVERGLVHTTLFVDLVPLVHRLVLVIQELRADRRRFLRIFDQAGFPNEVLKHAALGGEASRLGNILYVCMEMKT